MKTQSQHFTGSIILNFEDGEESGLYRAKISQAVLREAELVIEFSGHDSHEGRYSGSCKLEKHGESFQGQGTFKSAQGNSEATVKAIAEENGAGLLLTGTWQDKGDPDSYELEIELEPSAQV